MCVNLRHNTFISLRLRQNGLSFFWSAAPDPSNDWVDAALLSGEAGLAIDIATRQAGSHESGVKPPHSTFLAFAPGACTAHYRGYAFGRDKPVPTESRISLSRGGFTPPISPLDIGRSMVHGEVASTTNIQRPTATGEGSTLSLTRSKIAFHLKREFIT